MKYFASWASSDCKKSVGFVIVWSGLLVVLVHAADNATDPARASGDDLNSKVQSNWRYIVIGVASALFLVTVMLYVQVRKSRQDRALQDLNDLLQQDTMRQRTVLLLPHDSESLVVHEHSNVIDPNFLEQQYPTQVWMEMQETQPDGKKHPEEQNGKMQVVLSKLCNQTCVICLEEFVDNYSLVRRLGCNHVFHRDCIDNWLKRSALCPLCKSSFVLYSYPLTET